MTNKRVFVICHNTPKRTKISIVNFSINSVLHSEFRETSILENSAVKRIISRKLFCSLEPTIHSYSKLHRLIADLLLELNMEIFVLYYEVWKDWNLLGMSLLWRYFVLWFNSEHLN